MHNSQKNNTIENALHGETLFYDCGKFILPRKFSLLWSMMPFYLPVKLRISKFTVRWKIKHFR